MTDHLPVDAIHALMTQMQAMIADHEKRYHRKKGRFKPPTVAEVAKEFPDIDAQEFVDFYQSKGWLVGKAKMKDWRAAARRAKKWGQIIVKKSKLLAIIGKICSKEDCGMPAVYKDTSGAYDHYLCREHLPEKVKQFYG